MPNQSAEWGDFEWGDAEWGEVDTGAAPPSFVAAWAEDVNTVLGAGIE